jgi:hypothetical protein
MIHLVWSGKGYIVPLVAFASSLLTEILVEAHFNDERYYQEHGWPIFTALAVAGLIVREVAPRLFRERKLRDEATGELVVLKEDHTFFFIHIKHWGIILVIAAAVAFYAVERNKNKGMNQPRATHPPPNAVMNRGFSSPAQPSSHATHGIFPSARQSNH